MSIKKHLSLAVAVLAIALAAATSFAPRAHASFPIVDDADAAIVAEALERLVDYYEECDTGELTDYVRAREKAHEVLAAIKRLEHEFYEVIVNTKDLYNYSIDVSVLELMEDALLVDHAVASAFEDYFTLYDLYPSHGDHRLQLLQFTSTLIVYEDILLDEEGLFSFEDDGDLSFGKDSLAVHVDRLKDYVEDLRPSASTSAGTLESSGIDVGLGPVAPVIMAAGAGVATAAIGYGVVSRRRAK